MVDLVVQANKSGCRFKLACKDLEIDFKSFLRWKRDPEDKRHGPITTPKNKLSQAEKDMIIEVATSKEYVDDSPWVIVSKLADKGEYLASESTFYKVLKERKMSVHRGKSKPSTRKRPEALVATGANEIWTWDITYLNTLIKGQYYFLYLFMDIFSRKIVGFDIHKEESMHHSSELVSKLCSNEKVARDQLVLHSDNGGPMKGATMLATLEKLGVAASFSRPRVSNDNPYSESLFKTLKYCPKYPDYFSSLAEAKIWTTLFVDWYNNRHHHSGIKFVTPSDRHQGLDRDILMQREIVYSKAKKKNPERWSNRKTRNWSRSEKVYLNYLQRSENLAIRSAS